MNDTEEFYNNATAVIERWEERIEMMHAAGVGRCTMAHLTRDGH